MMGKRTMLCVVAAVVALCGLMPAAQADTLSYFPVTDDASSGISSSKTYTHAVDFGSGTPGANINGVQFTAATTGTLPANVQYDVTSGGRNDNSGNGNHNVTGNVVNLFTDMIYNGNNAAGGAATVTLQGLIPGVEYDARFYTRQWGAGSRTSAIGFDTNADTIPETTVTISQDNASLNPPGFPDADQAYALSYQYTAESSSLSTTFTQAVYNASWHQYGVSNEFVADTATVKVRVTADDSYKLLVTGIPDLPGCQMGEAGGWGTYEDWQFEVPIGQTMYLHIIGENGSVSPSGIIAQLEAEFALAETGSLKLCTDATWQGNLTDYGDAMVAVTDLGAYGVGPWGTTPGAEAFDSDAHWIWLGSGNRPAGETVYLTVAFTVTPEPTTALLLVGGLAALLRRRRRSA